MTRTNTAPQPGPDDQAELREQKTQHAPNLAGGNGQVSPKDEAEFQRLAGLSHVDYDRERAAAAKKLKLRTATLDAEVDKLRPAGPLETREISGSALELDEIDPWQNPVNGAEVADIIKDVLLEYLILPPLAAVAITLWIFRSYCHDLFDFNPRLAFLSPEKRCGKTLMLMLLKLLTTRPLLASNMSPAAIFRTIDSAKPTLLIDEFDSFKDGNDELRGILNSGHGRSGAFVIRATGTGDDFEPRQYSTWTPIAIAAIGTLPDTLADRSIVIPMRRKKTEESVGSLRLSGRSGKKLRERFLEMARKVARWAAEQGEALTDAEPETPSGLDDRAADNWSGLLAIADSLGRDWPDRARQAAINLSARDGEDADTYRTRLLRDIRAVFQGGTERMSSRTLCERLVKIDDSPWSGWSHGKGLTPHSLGRLLGAFNIKSHDIRFDCGVLKGFYFADFTDAFERYISTPEQKDRN